MFKIIGSLALAISLTGCSLLSPGVKPTPTHTLTPAPSYALPTNCDIPELLKLDPKYEAFNQTADGVTDSLDCAIGLPNSDVGLFFGYSVRTEDEWLLVTAKLVGEGYTKLPNVAPDADIWRVESGIEESEGVNCSISGHVKGLSFSVTEPWTKCDDAWNKELIGYLLNHALVSSL